MDAINKLRQVAKETDAAEEVKNNIGNLTLWILRLTARMGTVCLSPKKDNH